MFFEPANGMRPSPLKHNPFNALVCPRPIGWVSTIGADGGLNLAPFCYFIGVSGDPPGVVEDPQALAEAVGEEQVGGRRGGDVTLDAAGDGLYYRIGSISGGHEN